MLIFLCLLIPFFVSCQIYQNGNVKIHITKGTTLSQQFSNTDSSNIDISTNTKVINLQSKKDIVVKKNESLTKKSIHKTLRKNVKITSKIKQNKIKSYKYKEVINERYNLIKVNFASHNNTAISITSQNTQQCAILVGSPKNIFRFQLTSNKILFGKNIIVNH